MNQKNRPLDHLISRCKSSLNSPLFRSAAIYTVSAGINGALPFFLMPVLTRFLSPSDYGLVSMFGILVAIIGVFAGLSVHGAIFNKFFEDGGVLVPNFIGNCLIVLATSSVGVAVLIYLGRDLLFKLTEFPISWLWCVVVVAVFNFITTIRLYVWLAKSKPVSYGLFQFVNSLVNVCFSIFLVLGMSLKWEGRVLSQVITAVLIGSLSLWLLLRDKLISFKPAVNLQKEALHFGVPLIPHNLGGLLIGMTDRVLITQLLGLADTGIYTVALQLGMVFTFFIESFNKAYAPWLYERLKNPTDTTKLSIVRGTYLYFIIIIITALIPGLIPEKILSLFLGTKFLQAKDYFPPLFIGLAFHGMYYMVCNYIFYSKKTKYLSYATFLSGIVNALAGYYFIKNHGAIGAAYGSMLAFGASFLFTWYLAQSAYPMPWFQVFQKAK